MQSPCTELKKNFGELGCMIKIMIGVWDISFVKDNYATVLVFNGENMIIIYVIIWKYRFAFRPCKSKKKVY